MSSIQKRPDGRWWARYRDSAGKEHARHFVRKVDGQRWLDEVTTALVTGSYIDPRTARTTVDQWVTTWLVGYRSRRPSSVRQAEVRVARIRSEFGSLPLAAVKPSLVKAWTAKLGEEGLSASYVYALHSRLSQLMAGPRRRPRAQSVLAADVARVSETAGLRPYNGAGVGPV